MMVSVIIPAYNAEKTITDALDSLATQDYSNFEAIIVDDGSTDASISIVRKYIENCRFKILLISQSNQGVAAARNRGITEASGKYLAFLDSDDIYQSDFLSALVGLAESNRADMVMASYSRARHTDAAAPRDMLSRLLSQEEAMEEWMYNNPPRLFCSILYRRELIEEKNIRFAAGTKYSEDLEFTWNYLLYAQSVIATPLQVYAYLDNPQSTVHNVNWSKTSLLDSTLRIGEALKSHNSVFYNRFDEFMFPRTIWAVARTFSGSGQYELLKRMQNEYSTSKGLKRLVRALLFKANGYRGEYAKKAVIVLTSLMYLIHPRLFYIACKALWGLNRKAQRRIASC